MHEGFRRVCQLLLRKPEQPPRLPFTKESEGKFRFVLDEKALRSIVTSRAKPGSRVFPCDMTDLFHPMIPFEFVDHLWAAMALRPEYTFMLLTKRPARMLEYISSRNETRFPIWDSGIKRYPVWPLPNVHLFARVEDQKTADERIPLLLQCPAAVRGVSYEPAIGPVDFTPWLVRQRGTSRIACDDCVKVFCEGDAIGSCHHHVEFAPLDGIIAGGESGPHARPANPQWFRDVRDACAEAGVAFYFKAWGEWAESIDYRAAGKMPTGVERHRFTNNTPDGTVYTPVFRYGHKFTGRLLDGRTHDDLPGGGK
jgi:protein gp37